MAASSAPAPSLRLRPSSSASRRATSPRAVPVGLLGVLAGRGQLLLDLVEGGHGLLVLGVEALLARVEPGDLVSRAVKSRCARSARVAASSRASVRRRISASAASTRAAAR